MAYKTLQFCTEAFTTPYKYQWLAFAEDRAVGTFKLDDGGWIDLDILISHTLSFDSIATVTFGRSDKHGDTIDKYEITGEGDAFRIFSTVIKMVQEWVKKYGDNVDVITFTAEKKDDPRSSRAKLYDRLAKKFKIKGWKYEKSDGTGRDVRFKFINLNPPSKEDKNFGYKV